MARLMMIHTLLKLLIIDLSIVLITLASSTVEVPPQVNLIGNSSFENSVTDWMSMDGYLASSVFDMAEPIIDAPPILEWVRDEVYPEAWAQRTTDEAYDGRYACKLDSWYETTCSAYVRLPGPGIYTISAWVKSTHDDTTLQLGVVSAARKIVVDGQAPEEGDSTIDEKRHPFNIGAKWQRVSFSAELTETGDGRYQVYAYLPRRYGADSQMVTDKFGMRQLLRRRIQRETVYIDAVQMERGTLSDYRPAAPIEVGARLLDTFDWLFVEGETPVLQIQSGSAGVNRIDVIIEDWQRKRLWKKHIEVTATEAAVGLRVSLELEHRGYMRAFVRASSADNQHSREIELPFGIVPPPVQRRDGVNSPFGLMFHINRVSPASSWYKPGFRPSIYEINERSAITAAKIGARWTKTMDTMPFATWVNTEPTRGEFQFADEKVRVLKKHGFHIYGKLTYAPDFAQKTFPDNYREFHAGPPGDLEAWDNYVRRTMEHYRGDLAIDYWHVWTEPFSGFFWRGSGQDYTDLAERTYKIARSIDPDIKVGVVNACSPWYRNQTRGLIDQILRTGTLAWGDFFTFHRPHAYGDAWEWRFKMPLEKKLTWVDGFNTFKEWMDRYGDGEMPMWNTELRQWTANGYLDTDRFATVGHSAVLKPEMTTTLEQSIAWIVRSHVISLCHGVERFIVYGMGNNGLNYDQSSYQQMKEPDGRPKPWMVGYAVMTHMLESTMPGERIDMNHDRVVCCPFKKDDDTLVVIWGLHTEVGEPNKGGPGLLTIQHRTEILYDVMGNKVDLNAAGKVHVPLEVQPYYLLFKNTDPATARQLLQQATITWSDVR